MFRPPPLPRTLEAALRDLSSVKPAVRVEAAHDLVAHAEGDARERTIRALEGALRRDTAPDVRAAAATALADAGATEALPSLLLAIEDDDVHVRQMALAALGELRDARATERLRRALSDARPEVRFQAVIAFPRVCTARDDTHAALERATRDDDPLVRHIAFRMAEEVATEAGDAIPEALLARARAELADAASPAKVRVACAIVLARSGDATARDVLVRVAMRDLATDDAEDEAAAIELCGELGLKAARPGLERRAFGAVLGLGRDRFAWHARVALARMGHERASREILNELSSWNRDRRTLAVAAAGRARLLAARDTIAAMRGNDLRADPAAVDEALEALAGLEAS